MVRKTLVLVTLVAFLLVSSLASASQVSQLSDVVPGTESCEVSPSQPDFLADTGAVALTSSEMEEVRGAWNPITITNLFLQVGAFIANYTAEIFGYDMRFTWGSPLCVGEDCI